MADENGGTAREVLGEIRGFRREFDLYCSERHRERSEFLDEWNEEKAARKELRADVDQLKRIVWAVFGLFGLINAGLVLWANLQKVGVIGVVKP
ncbi:MAG: hypothetical protein HY816_19905 [Candidatus Wallbacteria bacterium]|nr:hypothetical protein [Candidatus Wallbacteria bacterium]